MCDYMLGTQSVLCVEFRYQNQYQERKCQIGGTSGTSETSETFYIHQTPLYQCLGPLAVNKMEPVTSLIAVDISSFFHFSLSFSPARVI